MVFGRTLKMETLHFWKLLVPLKLNIWYYIPKGCNFKINTCTLIKYRLAYEPSFVPSFLLLATWNKEVSHDIPIAWNGLTIDFMLHCIHLNPVKTAILTWHPWKSVKEKFPVSSSIHFHKLWQTNKWCFIGDFAVLPRLDLYVQDDWRFIDCDVWLQTKLNTLYNI
jgi:hypothetical protein